jgi:hypothetical protein
MSKKKERGNDDDVKREKPLQAVLLADSFTTTFRPVSLELPKVLVFDFDWMHALASILQDNRRFHTLTCSVEQGFISTW